MKKRCLIVAAFIGGNFSMLFGIDCFETFQIDVLQAEKQYAADVIWCEENATLNAPLCFLDADITLAHNLGLAADRYGFCCDRGGDGCP